MLRSLRNISLKLRYMFSFLLILLVVVLFISVIYENNRESNIRYINTTMLEKFTGATDNISTIIRAVDDLASIATASNLPAKEGVGTAAFDSQVLALLGKLKSRLPEEVRVFMLPRGSRYIYTESELMRYNLFESMMRDEYNLAMSQFYYLCSSKNDYALIPIVNSDGKPNAIARIVPLPSENLDYSGSLIFLFPESLLTDELERYIGDLTGDIYIYDNYYKLLYEHVAQSEPQAAYSQLIRKKGVGLQKFDQHTITISGSHADMGLNYILCENNSSFYKELWLPQRNLLLRILMLIGILIALFVWLIYFNYIPIRRLTTEIIGEDQNPQDGNELAQIKTSYNNTVEEVKKLSDQLSGLMTVASRHFLIRWIQGQITTREVFDNQTKYFGLSFPHELFAVLYLPTAPLAQNAAEKEKLMHLLNTFCFQQQSTLSCDLPDKNTVLLIVNYDNSSDGSDALMSAARQLYTLLEDNGFEHLRFGVGQPCCDPLKLSDSFWEASVAVQFSLNEEKGMRFYSSQVDDANEAPNDHTLPPMPVSLMIDAISRGDSVVACRALREITAHIRAHAESLLLFRFYTSNLLNVILNASRSNHVKYTQTGLRLLIEYNSIQEFEENTLAFIEEICTQVLQNQKLADTSIHNRLMTYILEHYKDYSLSSQSVSENTGIPNKQITNIIRKETGLNFVQYVSYLRLNEFKRLLRETNRNITELVDEIGYSDVSNFLRKFKTMEGMTASQYRIQYTLSQKTPDEKA